MTIISFWSQRNLILAFSSNYSTIILHYLARRNNRWKTVCHLKFLLFEKNLFLFWKNLFYLGKFGMSTTSVQKSPTNQQLLITSHKVFFTVPFTWCLRSSMSVIRLYSNYNISKRVRHKYRELANQKMQNLTYFSKSFWNSAFFDTKLSYACLSTSRSYHIQSVNIPNIIK